MTVHQWRLYSLVFWVMFILFFVLIYVFQPEIFQHIFNYPGPGGPYVNTPSG